MRDLNINLPQPDSRIHQQPVIQKVCELLCEKRIHKHMSSSSYAYDTDAACSPASREQNMYWKRRGDPICAGRAWFEYSLVVQHWRKPMRYSFTPGIQLFDAVKTGDRVRLPVNPGALGVECGVASVNGLSLIMVETRFSGDM